MSRRNVAEIIAELTMTVSGSPVAKATDIAAMYRALQRMPIEDAAAVVNAMSGGRYAILSLEPPRHWNAKMKLGYRKLVKQAIEDAGQSG